jgi:hypothetical protein
MAPRKPITTPPNDWDDFLDDLSNQALGKTPTIPSIPSTTVPSTTSSRGRELSPVLKSQERELNYVIGQADRLGIDTSGYGRTQPIALPTNTQSSTSDYDDFLNDLSGQALSGTTPKSEKKKDDGGFWGGLGNAVLSGLGDVVNVIDIPRRVVISGVKELQDLAPGGDGASFGDFFSQVGDRNLSSRIIIPQTGIGWLDATAGFVGDIALDPTTYLTLGGSAIAKTAVTAGTKLAVKEVAEASVESLVKAGIKKEAIDLAQKTADDLIIIAKKTTDDVAKGLAKEGDDIIAQQAAVRASKEAKDLTMDAAKKLNGRGGKILKAEDARQVAYSAWSQAVEGGNKALIKTARKELDSATSYLARQGLIRGGVKRQYRATAREILGDNATQVRQAADDLLKAADGKLSSGLTLTAAEEAAVSAAKRTVADLSDEAIAKIYKVGYGALRKSGEGAGLALGTRTGSRLGVGRASFYLGKGTPTGWIGSSLSGLRSKAFSKAPGLLEKITPLGRRGIFGDADMLMMRRALQTGKDEVTGATLDAGKAKVYGSAIALQRAEEIVRKRTTQVLTVKAKKVLADITTDEEADVIKFLDSGIVPANTATAAKAAAVRDFLEETFQDYATRIKDLGQVERTSLVNYFPHVQSNDALRWLAKRPGRATQIADGLGTNRQLLADNFIQRELIPGKVWFGHTLTDADIKGGIARLNELARMGDQGVKFDFFETDLKTALAKYSQKHAASIAFMETVAKFSGRSADEIIQVLKNTGDSSYFDDIANVLPARGTQDALLQRGQKAVLPGVGGNEINRGLKELMRKFKADYTPEALRNFAKSDVAEIENRLIKIRNLLDESLTQWDDLSVPGLANPLIKEIEALNSRLADILALRTRPDSPILDSTLKLTLDEIDQTLLKVQGDPSGGFARIIDEDEFIDMGRAQKSGLLIDSTTGQPTVGANIPNLLNMFNANDVIRSGTGSLGTTIPKDVWKTIATTVEDGFVSLGMRDIPDVLARKEVAVMFNRLQQITDQRFASLLERGIGDFNTFFKSWATATVGFHFRNAVSNGFQLVAAGVGPRSMSEGIFYYNRYLVDTTRFAAEGKRFLTPEEWVQTLSVNSTKKSAILDALTLGGADGQMAEVFDDAKRIGVLGREINRGPLPLTRGTLGSPLKGSRALGQYVEGNTRFIMNYDAALKGLSPEEALARTNKYLFDYSNLSSLDKVAKQIIPFWIWTSRNFPLYLENIATNPKAYARVGQLQRATEGTEIPYLPSYNKEQGDYALNEGITGFLNSNPVTAALTGGYNPNKTVKLDFGFPGAGKPSQFDLLARALPSAVTGDFDPTYRALREIGGSTTPIGQIIFEALSGKDLFTDKDIVDKYSEVPGGTQRALNTASNFLPLLGYLGRQGQTVEALSPEVFDKSGLDAVYNFLFGGEKRRELAGLPEPYTYNKTDKEISDSELAFLEGRLPQFVGSPIRGVTVDNQSAEIQRQIKVLEELIRLEQLKK